MERYFSSITELPKEVIDKLECVVCVDSPMWQCTLYCVSFQVTEDKINIQGPVVASGRARGSDKIGYRLYDWYTFANRGCFWFVRPFDFELEKENEVEMLADLETCEDRGKS